MGTVKEKLQKALGTKLAIRQAIVSMGQAVAETEPFSAYADKIRAIRTGVETGDATAVAGDILSGQTAYVKGQKITGNIQSQAAKTVTPGTSTQTAVAAKRYTTGAVTVSGDANLKAENIKKDVSIFGVSGSAETVETASVNFTTDRRTSASIWISSKYDVSGSLYYWKTFSLGTLKNITIVLPVGTIIIYKFQPEIAYVTTTGGIKYFNEVETDSSDLGSEIAPASEIGISMNAPFLCSNYGILAIVVGGNQSIHFTV